MGLKKLTEGELTAELKGGRFGERLRDGVVRLWVPKPKAM